MPIATNIQRLTTYKGRHTRIFDNSNVGAYLYNLNARAWAPEDPHTFFWKVKIKIYHGSSFRPRKLKS